MQLAIISDIHEDYQSLERALADMRRRGFVRLVCLGDITGYSDLFHTHTPDANACIDMLIQHQALCIAGNHDLFTAKRLASYHEQLDLPENWYELSPEGQYALTGERVWLYEDEQVPDLQMSNMVYLQDLPERHVLSLKQRNILFSHFYYPDHVGITRWFPKQTSELSLHFRMMKDIGCGLAFVGHSHPVGAQLIQKYAWSEPHFQPFDTGAAPAIICCPPIVSGSKPSGYLLYDADNCMVSPVFL